MQSGGQHDSDESVKVMKLRYAGTCRDCGSPLEAGTRAVYDKSARNVLCLDCYSPSPGTTMPTGDATSPAAPEPVEAGTAGGSARREFERRHAQREKRVREAHPRIGGLLLALVDDPQSTRAWDAGARGEEALGRTLDSLSAKGVLVLHDRRIRGTKANIDHIAVSPSGVWVIDAKRYAGKRPSLRVEGGILRARVEKLLVGSSDRTKLVDGVEGQVAKVRAALDTAAFAAVPVRGVLCFLDADWPLFGAAFTVRDVAVRWPERLASDLVGPGSSDAATIDATYRCLAEAFPVA